MQTNVQLFRDGHKLTALSVGDPSLTLVRNDEAFGLLLAEGAHEDSFKGRFYLDNVTYLQCVDGDCSYSEFGSVAIYKEDEIWVAQEMESGRYFPKPSKRPYRVVFISHAEFKRLGYFRAEGLALPVMAFAQRLFGRLPGFSLRSDRLSAPQAARRTWVFRRFARLRNVWTKIVSAFAHYAGVEKAEAPVVLPVGRPIRRHNASRGAEDGEAPLILPVASLCGAWPQPFRSEALAVKSATIALPAAAVATGLAKGKVTFPWSQIRSWLTPPPSSPTRGRETTDLVLPLKVVAPAFFAITDPEV